MIQMSFVLVVTSVWVRRTSPVSGPGATNSNPPTQFETLTD
jgi:hypothetical protein